MKHEPVSPLQVQPNGEQLQIINDHLEKVWCLTLNSLLICLLTAVCMAEASCYLSLQDEITLIVDKIFWLKDIRYGLIYARFF